MMSCVIYYCCEWQTRRPLIVTSCTTSRDAPMCERGKSHHEYDVCCRTAERVSRSPCKFNCSSSSCEYTVRAADSRPAD